MGWQAGHGLTREVRAGAQIGCGMAGDPGDDGCDGNAADDGTLHAAQLTPACDVHAGYPSWHTSFMSHSALDRTAAYAASAWGSNAMFRS